VQTYLRRSIQVILCHSSTPIAVLVTPLHSRRRDAIVQVTNFRDLHWYRQHCWDVYVSVRRTIFKETSYVTQVSFPFSCFPHYTIVLPWSPKRWIAGPLLIWLIVRGDFFWTVYRYSQGYFQTLHINTEYSIIYTNAMLVGKESVLLGLRILL
jgi:hypothetical protein